MRFLLRRMGPILAPGEVALWIEEACFHRPTAEQEPSTEQKHQTRRAEFDAASRTVYRDPRSSGLRSHQSAGGVIWAGGCNGGAPSLWMNEGSVDSEQRSQTLAHLGEHDVGCSSRMLERSFL